MADNQEQLPFDLTVEESAQLPTGVSVSAALQWARETFPDMPWDPMDRNKASFAVQKWMENYPDRYGVPAIRSAVAVLRPLEFCRTEQIRPVYVPWRTPELGQQLEEQFSKDRRSNLIVRAQYFLSLDLGLGHHIRAMDSMLDGSPFSITTIREDGFMYTIGNYYSERGTELYLLINADLETSSHQALAAVINTWSNFPAEQTTAEYVVGKTVAEVLPGANSVSGIATDPSRTFRLMTQEDKSATMGYAAWFYINFADVNVQTVPYCVVDLRLEPEPDGRVRAATK